MLRGRKKRYKGKESPAKREGEILYKSKTCTPGDFVLFELRKNHGAAVYVLGIVKKKKNPSRGSSSPGFESQRKAKSVMNLLEVRGEDSASTEEKGGRKRV